MSARSAFGSVSGLEFNTGFASASGFTFRV